jgi:hypothetical protein
LVSWSRWSRNKIGYDPGVPFKEGRQRTELSDRGGKVADGNLIALAGSSRTSPPCPVPGGGKLSTAACWSFLSVTSRPWIINNFQPWKSSPTFNRNALLVD